MYNNYLNERQEAIDAGATHYTAKELIDSRNVVFNLSTNVKLTILDQKYYHQKQSSGENNHSVCALLSHNDTRHFLFTGDLELEGEESLAGLNELPEVELFKAGHHGSKTSSNEVLLSEIKPKSVCVCCCAGTSEYTDTNANQFPTQEFINRVAPYTDKVYVTSQVDNDSEKTYKSMNGNIVVKSKMLGLEWNFSNNNLKLKDTVWFLENRQMPSAWATA
jgi:beta-lactamase superfamily II metal-dependent hydrolase